MAIPLAVGECLDHFKILSASNSGHKDVVADVFGRFRVWAGNVSAHSNGKRSLQYRLRDSSELTAAVLTYLKDLLDALGQMEAKTSIENDDELSFGEDDEEGDEELFEVKYRQSPAQEALEEVDDIISGLMRISMALRNPARNEQVRYADTALARLHQPRDAEHVRTKYPELPLALAERLGKTISQHRQYFKYRREHNEKLTHGIDDSAPDDDETRQSTVATSLFKPGDRPVSFHEDSDNESIGTATSFAPSETGDTLLRPPPRPEAAIEGLPFECNICYHIINAPDERRWRQHVYEDLPPYTCIHENCQSVTQQFSRRREWRRHMLDHYRYWVCPYDCAKSFTSAEDHHQHLKIDHHEDHQDVVLKSLSKSCARDNVVQFAQCPFCYEEKSNHKLWFRHVGHHLERLALFALPTHIFAADSDGQNEGDVGSADPESGSAVQEYHEVQQNNEEDLERRDRLVEVAAHDELLADGVHPGNSREMEHRNPPSHVSGKSYNASDSLDTQSRGGVMLQSGGTVLHVYGQANIEMRQDEDGGTAFVIGRGKSHRGGKGSQTRSEEYRGRSRSRRRLMIEEDSFDEEDYTSARMGGPTIKELDDDTTPTARDAGRTKVSRQIRIGPGIRNDRSPRF